ncbi:PAAR domain-containing protein [Paraburkholderia sprentiae WSM5005]|uniref:PAAR domain-containing protein n=1 Tax=Paraburkholderia sprentiae WSM5005 TaxID=754502 RepID=A0A8F4KHQ6_9BURK|nr:PAAR domain-containing protein [Paraburkholderia sprentiae]QXE07298.1 PAAR domain-containing protein [Paraburkholderia sprentiae WSM5005]
MSVRHDIRDGDSTTANGRVIATLGNDMIDGRAAAYEGDPVVCPTCNTTGKIVCVGERVPERGPDRRQSALSGDWCLCDCRPCPLLIPSQYRSSARA